LWLDHSDIGGKDQRKLVFSFLSFAIQVESVISIKSYIYLMWKSAANLSHKNQGNGADLNYCQLFAWTIHSFVDTLESDHHFIASS
jgi:hypothetical protein